MIRHLRPQREDGLGACEPASQSWLDGPAAAEARLDDPDLLATWSSSTDLLMVRYLA